MSEWRNWQPRNLERVVGKTVRVRVPLPTPIPNEEAVVWTLIRPEDGSPAIKRYSRSKAAMRLRNDWRCWPEPPWPDSGPLSGKTEALKRSGYRVVLYGAVAQMARRRLFQTQDSVGSTPFSATRSMICRNGGTGRRDSFKNCCPPGREGSTPSSGTRKVVVGL